MSPKDEIIAAQKAMAYDLQCLLESSEKETYTVEEIKKIMRDLIAAKEQTP